MTNIYSYVLLHIVWCTKNREPLISVLFKERLYAYIKEIIEDKKGKILALNGMPDHIHLLVCLSVNTYIPSFMRQLKSMTTKWIRTEIPSCQSFAWQEGYSVFSVGLSTVKAVVKYIQNQELHHQKISFDDEYTSFLKKHTISFDHRSLFN